MTAEVARCIVVTFNVLFMVIAAVFFLIGSILRFGWTVAVRPILVEMLELSEEGGKNVAFDATEVGFRALVENIGCILMIIGAVVFAISLFGCIGACWNLRRVVTVYSCFVLLVFVGQLIAIILLFATTTYQFHITLALQETIYDGYAGVNATDPTSVAWNFFMVALKCCGAQDYRDFDRAKYWRGVKQKVPVTCCKFVTKFPHNDRPVDPDCVHNPTDENSYFQIGCFQQIKLLINRYSAKQIGVLVTLSVLELVFIIFTCYIRRKNVKRGIFTRLYTDVTDTNPGYFVKELGDLEVYPHQRQK